MQESNCSSIFYWARRCTSPLAAHFFRWYVASANDSDVHFTSRIKELLSSQRFSTKRDRKIGSDANIETYFCDSSVHRILASSGLVARLENKPLQLLHMVYGVSHSDSNDFGVDRTRQLVQRSRRVDKQFVHVSVVGRWLRQGCQYPEETKWNNRADKRSSAGSVSPEVRGRNRDTA